MPRVLFRLSFFAIAFCGSAVAQELPLPPLTCEHAGNGTSYNVGPGQAHASVGAVPWENLAAGDTVRIHWRAQPYREKILLRRRGTAQQPIVVCGVPGPNGELPVLDGENATTRATMGYRVVETEARGLVHVSWGAGDAWGYKPGHLVIQGLELRNAFHEYTFTASDGSSRSYTANAAGIFIERGEHIVVRGVVVTGNGNGFFVASGGSEEVLSRDIALERSRLYGNGTVTVGFDRHHNIYTEAVGMLFQFNYIGPLRAGAGGSAMKDRSAGTVVRYNHIEGGARSMDLVEAEESFPMMQNLPEYRRTFVYGNVIVNGPDGPSYMIHYGGDNGSTNTYRKGWLYFHENTIVVRADQSARWRTILFDVATNDESVDARNNVLFVRSATPGQAPTNMKWMRTAGYLELGANWASSGVEEWRDGVTPTGTIVGLSNVIGNAANDPGFMDEAGNDFSLRANAQAVDAGIAPHPQVVSYGHKTIAEYAAVAHGRPRPVSGAPDLGAFERGGGHPLQYLGKGPAAWDNGLRLACSGVSASPAAVLCVRAGAAAGGNGSQVTPFATITAAITAAKAGDIVQVAAGPYAENVAIGSYSVPSGKDLTLLGGFSSDFSQRDAGQHSSIINAGQNAPGVQLHIDSTGTTTLDGFIVTGGRGLGTGWEDGYGHGGGVYAQRLGNGVTVISHNRIHGNRSTNHTSADTRGGGIHVYNQSWGGATGTVRIEDNHVYENLAGKGAGINVTGRQATLLRNRVEDNIAHSDHGGGVYISTGQAQLTDNAILGNQIGATVGYGWGGGVIVAGEISAQFRGNVVTDNYAPTIGAGLFFDEGAVVSMRNDLIFDNRCPQDARSGAAIYLDGGAAPSMLEIENATIADHHCSGNAPAIYIEDGSQAVLKNSILWGNSGEFGVVSGGGYGISYSTTQQPGQGNLALDPLFASPASGDYHLRSSAGRYTSGGWVVDVASSPAIDAGDPASDYSLETTPNGGRINLGAYGNTAEASRSGGATAGELIFGNGFE